jgi:membrane-associated protease RseP (regulator of RpoE activity)
MKRHACRAIALCALLMLVVAAAAAEEGSHERVLTVRADMERGTEGSGVGRVMVFADGQEEPQVFSWTGHGFRRPLLGVQPLGLTPELREHYGAPEDAGVLVARVEEDSAAAEAGIEVGDVITAVDGQPVARVGDLVRAVSQREAGDQVEVTVIREGRKIPLQATLKEGERPALDFGYFFSADPDHAHLALPFPPDGDLELVAPELEGALERLASPEVREKIDSYLDHSGELLQRRIDELERRLAEVERELEAEKRSKP